MGSETRSFTFILMATLGGLIFSLFSLYLIFVLFFSISDIYVSLEYMGLFMVLAFLLTLGIAGLFYYVAVESRVGAWKMR